MPETLRVHSSGEVLRIGKNVHPDRPFAATTVAVPMLDGTLATHMPETQALHIPVDMKHGRRTEGIELETTLERSFLPG